MKIRLLEYLACPNCLDSQFTLEIKEEREEKIYHSHFRGIDRGLEGVQFAQREEIEVEEGVLHCGKCGQHYLIKEGIPRMILGENSERNIQSGHRLTRFDAREDLSVWEKNFQELIAPLNKDSFVGKTVLDLGCGYGR